jgi:hypothetical protein
MCEIRNSATVIINFIKYCKQKEVYPNLPKRVRNLVDIAEQAVKDYEKADGKISKIFHRLPEETLRRYSDHKNSEDPKKARFL